MTSGNGLYRSSRNKVFAGVCGGLGEHLKIDPVLLRVIFVLLSIFALGGLIAYIALWIALPVEPIQYSTDNQAQDTAEVNKQNIDAQQPKKGQLVVGLTLITIGALFLISAFIPRFDLTDLWPLLLIGLGVILLSNVAKN